MRRHIWPTRLELGVAVSAAILALVASTAPALANVVTVGGSAFGESLSLAATGHTPIAYGPVPNVILPPTGGGPFTKHVSSVGTAGILTIGSANVSTQGALGAGGSVQSSASLANIAVFGGEAAVGSISSRCTSTQSGSTGSSAITRLVVDGETFTPSATPNLVLYNHNGLKVVSNEIVNHDKANMADIKVSAVHVSLNRHGLVGELYLAQSRCHAEGPNVLIPEAPSAVLMPLTGLVLVGAAALVAWWRPDKFQSLG